MKQLDIRYWRDSIKMCEKAMKPRAERWAKLKERLGQQFRVDGVKDPVRINRIYKITREIIASVAYRYPYVLLKAEEDPSDPITGETLKNSSDILEDFGNDSLEMMRCKRKVQQIIFDALFTFRGWGKIGYLYRKDGNVAPYVGSDAMMDDFTYFRRVSPENILIDPLCGPEEIYDARYIIEKMYVSLDDLVDDPRFEKYHSQLMGERKKGGNATVMPLDPEEEGRTKDDVEREVMQEAYRLANIRCAYEVHDRVDQRRIFFVDGIEQPIEEIDHPMLAEEVQYIPDPATGQPIMQSVIDPAMGTEGTVSRRRWLVEGGFQYFSLAFDTSDLFYGEPIMSYENPIQNAIIKSVSRRLDILERFKRMGKVRRAEAEAHPDVMKVLKSGEDGELIQLDEMDNLQELTWGNVPPDQIRLEMDMLRYEQDIVRTSSNSNPDTATEAALSASEAQLNREFNQAPVEELYCWIVRNAFSVLSQPQYTPASHLLRLTSQQGAQRTQLALQSWHLQGRFNINIAAGSMNVLYEQMQKDRTLSLVNFLRQSPNVDQLELDKYVIRAHGEVDPDKLLKDDANIDAAKAAELELQMMFASQHDPGVTPQEDHNTHLKFQHPSMVQRHPRFAQLPPEMQQFVMRIATGHAQQHQAYLQQQTGAVARPSGASTRLGPDTLRGQIQSNAQRTEEIVSQSAKEGEMMP